MLCDAHSRLGQQHELEMRPTNNVGLVLGYL